MNTPMLALSLPARLPQCITSDYCKSRRVPEPGFLASQSVVDGRSQASSNACYRKLPGTRGERCRMGIAGVRTLGGQARCRKSAVDAGRASEKAGAHTRLPVA